MTRGLGYLVYVGKGTASKLGRLSHPSPNLHVPIPSNAGMETCSYNPADGNGTQHYYHVDGGESRRASEALPAGLRG